MGGCVTTGVYLSLPLSVSCFCKFSILKIVPFSRHFLLLFKCLRTRTAHRSVSWVIHVLNCTQFQKFEAVLTTISSCKTMLFFVFLSLEFCPPFLVYIVVLMTSCSCLEFESFPCTCAGFWVTEYLQYKLLGSNGQGQSCQIFCCENMVNQDRRILEQSQADGNINCASSS